MHIVLAAALLLGHGLTLPGAAPQEGARQRSREIAASFSKSKHKIKEKLGVRVEKFKEVRSEPVDREDVRQYSALYEADSGYTIRVEVGGGGRVEASGSEPGPGRPLRFTLVGGKIEGALLTGTKVYDDGTTEKFEGVFIARTERDSPAEGGTTTFGLGVIYDPPKAAPYHGMVLSKLFYQLKR